MATIGLGAILHGVAEGVWGGANLALPQLLPRSPLMLGEILVPGQVLWSFALAVALIAGFTAYFHYSKGGVSMRAAASDPSPRSDGHRRAGDATSHLDLCRRTGLVAGIIVASTTSLSPTLGTVALGVLAVIILGGLDSIAGAIVAGLIVGWLESLTVAFFGGQARDVVPYLVVLVILMVRPYGLFGTRDIERL